MTSAKSPEDCETMTPEQCETMADVRAGVDQVDRELVALLVRRFGYMDAAARIKPDRAAVRDEARKAEVLDNAVREAAKAGLDPDRIRAVWNELVEQSIAHELDRWDGIRG
jgi:isochorismate pyruvate lyase